MITRTMTAIAIFVIASTTLYADEPAKPLLPSEVEKAVLAEDWGKVTELLAEVDTNTPSSVLRLIKGHACLALNRNNESLKLFASTLEDKCREQWQTWVGDFVRMNGDNPIAWYLQGDLFARQRKWNSAIKSFDRALEIDANSYLALNARGVVAHAVGNTLMARTYFVKAIKARKDFSDALSSRGTLSVYLKSEKGETYFYKAKDLSEDHNPVLPLLGLGCSNYGRQEYDSASRYFNSIPELSAMYPLAQRNVVASELAKLGQAIRDAERVGTSIRTIDFASDRGIPEGNSDEIGPEVTIISVEVAEDGTTYILLSDGRLVVIPPPEGNDEGDPDDDGDDNPSTGLFLAMAPSAIPYLDAKIQLLTLKALRDATAQVEQRTTIAQDAAITADGAKPGGADSDPSKARSNRGSWGVSNVYGLLYPIHGSKVERLGENKSKGGNQ
ncbi:tetratricopeptide repeat protein [bacterium]|nr:tetratricopeptide repeat protein [bacterium]